MAVVPQVADAAVSDSRPLSDTEIRDLRMTAMDAQRLASDPTLKGVLDTIRAAALRSCVYDPDAASREQGRQLVVAIDALRGELEVRIQTAFDIAEAQRRERIFE